MGPTNLLSFLLLCSSRKTRPTVLWSFSTFGFVPWLGPTEQPKPVLAACAFDVFPFRFVQFYFRLLAHSSEGGLSPRVQVVAGDLSVFLFSASLSSECAHK